MAQEIINYGAAANDGTGDPLRTAFIKTDNNFDQIWAAGPVGSNITIINNTVSVVNTNGNLVLNPNGVGVIQTNSRVVPRTTNTYDLGSPNLTYRSAYIGTGGLSVAGNLSVSGALSAANLAVSGNVTFPADVVIDGNLTVNGETVVVNVSNLVIEDKTIVLANGTPNAAAADGAGIIVDGANASILYDSTANIWTMNIGLDVDGLNTTNSFAVTTNGFAWFMGGEILGTPNGGTWYSDTVGNDEYISSAFDGYISMSALYASGNVASELDLEHGQLRLNANDTSGNSYTWQLGYSQPGGSVLPDMGVPGNIIPAGNVAQMLGSSVNPWTSVYASNLFSQSLAITTNGFSWFMGGDILTTPNGGSWYADTVGNDEYISSAFDGYISMSALYSSGNVASELDLEHGQLRLNVHDFDDSIYTWQFGQALPGGVVPDLVTPGNILPGISNAYSLGNATNQWSDLWVSNNTIYINSVPVTMGAGNVLQVNGEALLSNDSNTSIVTTGNITANSFIGDGSQLTGLPAGYANADVVTLLSSFGSNVITTTGNITGGNIITAGSVNTGGNVNFTSAEASDTARIFADVSGTTTSLVLEVGDDDASDSIVLRHYSFDAGTTLDMLTARRSSNTQANVSVTGNISATGNVSGNFFIGDGSQLTGIAASYGNANVATFLAAYGSNTVVTTGNITGGNLISSATIFGNVDVVLGNIANAAGTKTRMVTDTTFSYIQTGNGTIGSTGNIVFSPYSSPTQQVVIDTSSGNLSAAGNVTAQNFIGNISITGNVTGTSANVDLVAGAYDWTFDNTGNVTLPGNTFAVNYANGTPVDIITRFESAWTVPVGNSTQSFTVDPNETYQLWVDCNIPNGILTWNATATITNTNVPVVGAQYAWVYTGGGTPIDFTSIPNQFVGTANTIVRSSVAPSATTNRFDFGINNTSGNTQVVRYGWIKIS